MKISFDLKLIKKMIILYFPMTLVEHYLTLGSMGSAVKLYGFFIIISYVLYKLSHREKIVISKDLLSILV